MKYTYLLAVVSALASGVVATDMTMEFYPGKHISARCEDSNVSVECTELSRSQRAGGPRRDDHIEGLWQQALSHRRRRGCPDPLYQDIICAPGQ
jgi:Tfp pilus assembly protein PilV